METCKLQIILHSAKGLTDVKNFGTMDPYAVVWTDRNGKPSKPRKTEVAKKGASSPVWECPMIFNVLTSMQNNYTLMFEIKHDGKVLDRNIGQVEVPFKDLLAGDGFGENVSYPVKISSGEKKGEIIVSHKFIKQQDVNSSEEKVNGRPKKKVTKPKKKHGMMRRVANNVATKVAADAVILAGTVGLLVAFGVDEDEGVVGVEDEDVNEDEDEGVVGVEDEDVNEDEDEDEEDV